MTDDVKRQIGILIEQAGDPQHRAMLLVLLNMADCLAETSKINAELLSQVENIKNQVSTAVAQRSVAIRTMDKVMPYIIGGILTYCGWIYSTISELETYKIKHEEFHRITEK